MTTPENDALRGPRIGMNNVHPSRQKNVKNRIPKPTQAMNQQLQKLKSQVNNMKKQKSKPKKTTRQYTEIKGSRSAFLNQISYNEKNRIASYYKSVLCPFTTQVSRGPSDFYMPTSILDYKFTKDITFGNTAGAIVLYPWFLGGQQSTNSPCWFNNQSYADVNTVQSLGGAGISINQSPMFGSTSAPCWTESIASSEGSTGRWLSARVVRCGIRIIPQSNIQTKQGTLTIGMIPGKTNGANNSWNSLPTVQQLRQYPTSYEVGLSTLGPTGTDYVWLPLDPCDLIFEQGSRGIDPDQMGNQFRSPMVCLFGGISSQDSYHVQVSIAYEFVPVPSFESWCPVEPSGIDSTVTRTLNKIVSKDVAKAISGQLGQSMFQLGKVGVGQMVGNYNPILGLASSALL